MIDWTDKAIDAALQELHGTDWRGLSEKMNAEALFEMRAALNAAVQAQGMTAGWINRAVDDAYQEGRADALEEAAKWFDAQGYVAGARDLRYLKEEKE